MEEKNKMTEENKKHQEPAEEKEKREEKLVGTEVKKEQTKETKEEIKKIKKPEIKKKDKAFVRGKDLSISTKKTIAICKFIRGKKIEQAISDLELVVRKKKAIPTKMEMPHRKGMERGCYPVKASKEMIRLLKSLLANCNVNMLEEPYLYIVKADRASLPFKRGGMRFKRTHVYLEAREKINKQEKSKESKEKRK